MNKVSNSQSGLNVTVGDLEVRRMAFGAMQFHPAKAFWRASRQRRRAGAVLSIVESGVNFIDTADARAKY
jgi:aryl-alcohol dehydrogenase-like predicted oxidoreductase